MAGNSYPFDDGPGASISEDQWSFLVKDAVGTGVHEGLAGGTGPGTDSVDLKVFSLEEPGTLHVTRGRATIDGFHYHQASNEVVAVVANGDATNDRIDAVSLILDLVANTISLVVKQGTPATSPVPPSREIGELRLAEFRVRKSSNVVLPNEVFDRRPFIGRRMRFNSLGYNPSEGDISYVPELQSWHGEKNGSSDTFLMASTHTGASDPHSQYAKKSDFSIEHVSITPTALIQLSLNFCRVVNLPGGLQLFHININGKFDGATDQQNFIIAQIDNSDYWPEWSHYYAGQQFPFANTTDDYPFVVRIDPLGNITAVSTRLMGGAFFVLNGMWLLGDGVV